jgi:CTP:phosphocholine cytidylyltransferase-like protein
MSGLSQRSTFQTIDELGIDPLRDKSIDSIMAVVGYSQYTITHNERYNAPLISYNAYRDENFWWHIMVYNGIEDTWELKPGVILRIPDMNELITRLNDVMTSIKTVRTVSI